MSTIDRLRERRRKHPLPTGLKADKAFFGEMWGGGPRFGISVDASALVAIPDEEADHSELAERLDGATDLFWSAMSCREAIGALRRSRETTLGHARDDVEAYAVVKRFRLVAIGEEERSRAPEAYRRYGKGRHPARLHMGDCFAYACAETNIARLLYPGEDFARTDPA